MAQAPNRKPSPSRNVKRRNSARAFPCVVLPVAALCRSACSFSPCEVPGPDLGHIKRFLNRKSGSARTNCASLTLLGASAAGTTFAVASAGCAGGAQWQGRGQGLVSVGSGPGTVTELLRNPRNGRRQLFTGPPFCPFPATISQKTRPRASPKPPYCSTGVQLHTHLAENCRFLF